MDEFCSLPALPDVDLQIQGAERDLAATQRQDSIRDMSEFEPIELPTFDLDALKETLELNLPDLDPAAAARVQRHFQDIGQGGELWVASGMDRIAHLPNDSESCPFCAQDLTGPR